MFLKRSLIPTGVPFQRAFRRWLIVISMAVMGCDQTASIHGKVLDIRGEALPAVAVTVEQTQPGTPAQALSNGIGEYRLRCVPGSVNLNFVKTGYTFGKIRVDTYGEGQVEVRDMELWPLPEAKGVFRFDQFRFYPATPTEPVLFRTQDGGTVLGTKITPELILPPPEGSGPDQQWPVLLMAHKLPPWDLKLNQLVESKVFPWLAGREPSGKDVPETAWIPGETIKMLATPVDEPQPPLLLELQPARMLTPGRYALHWGALEGHKEIDARIFLFAVAAPPAPPAPVPQPAPAPVDAPPKKKNK